MSLPAAVTAIPAATAAGKHLNSLFLLCSTAAHLRQLHSHLVVHGFHLSTFFGSKLASSYFSFSSSGDARLVFDEIPSKNSQSWNTILACYFRSHSFFDLFHLYKLLRWHDNPPDSFSLVFALRACGELSHANNARSFHSEAIKFGLACGDYVSPAVLNMYAELNCLEYAQKVFDETPVRSNCSWGLLMKAYLKASLDDNIIELFCKMKHCGINLDPLAAVCLARAYGNIRSIREGRAIHGYCLKKNFLESNIYLHTSLIYMYCKSGLIDCGSSLFEQTTVKDVVLWSSIISGLAQCGKALESFFAFREMLEALIVPNEVTLSSLLLACSHLGALHLGKSVHGYLLKNQVAIDVVTCTALLDMYGKCGSFDLSRRVFDLMEERNVFTWSAMINAYAVNGMCSEALALFEQMRLEKITPNPVTFVPVLSACSRSGKVDEGRSYFDVMIKDYQITPKDEHYSCMVDLLGRGGLISEAENLIKGMSSEPSASTWGALLGACRIHKRAKLAEEVAEKLFDLEPDQPGAHILLSNIYADAEMWHMVNKTRDMMNKSGLRKTFGYSSIEIDKRIYLFSVLNRFDGESQRNAEVWNSLCSQMKDLFFII